MDMRNGILSAAMSVTNQSCPQIYLLDLRSLAKERVRIRMVAGSNEPTVLDPHVTLTDTRLIEAHGTKLTIREFWYYQVSNWELDTFLSQVSV